MIKFKGPNWRIEKEKQNIDDGTKTKICVFCKEKFQYRNTRQNLCGKCIIYIKCKNCHQEFSPKDFRGKIPNESEEILEFCSKKCALSFRNKTPEMREVSRKNGIKRGKQVQSLIGQMGKCSICGNNRILVDVSLRCQKCSEEQNQNIITKNKLSGKCSICGKFVENRDQNARGKECGCSSKWYRDHNNTDNMKKVSSNNLKIINDNFRIIDNLLFYKDKEINELTEELNSFKVKIPNGFFKKNGEWYFCNVLLKCENINELNNSIFQLINGKRYYYGIEASEFVKKLDSGEILTNEFYQKYDSWFYQGQDVETGESLPHNKNINSYHGKVYFKGQNVQDVLENIDSYSEVDSRFRKRFGEWWFQNINVLTGEKFIFNNSNFQEYKGKLYVKDNRINEYVLWNDLKADWTKQTDDLSKSELFLDIKERYPQAMIIPTFIENIDHNSNLRYMTGLGILNQYLKELGIEWFAYGKFCLKDYDIAPLVYGKSGSISVNNQGIDLDFSMNEEDGPARRFLNSNNLVWEKNQILMIPSNNESESLEIESNLSSFGFMFGS